ncbi:MAG: DUF433 domain-containing protein [Chthoniobacterales bacterium]|nr:DUF433 domain-containing protein [Chthoniobacterales bacterium]
MYDILNQRITFDPQVMSGQPCIRGLRVTVANILRMLAAHHDHFFILKAYPYLEEEDIDACLEYAAYLSTDHEVLTTA